MKCASTFAVGKQAAAALRGVPKHRDCSKLSTVSRDTLDDPETVFAVLQYELGLELISAGRWHAALSTWSHLRQSKRKSPPVLKLQLNVSGFAALLAGDYEDALLQWEQSLLIEPELSQDAMTKLLVATVRDLLTVIGAATPRPEN